MALTIRRVSVGGGSLGRANQRVYVVDMAGYAGQGHTRGMDLSDL
jgi:hypothetical protein